MPSNRISVLTFVFASICLNTASAHPGHLGMHPHPTPMEAIAAFNGMILMGFVFVSFIAWIVLGWIFSNTRQKSVMLLQESPSDSMR